MNDVKLFESVQKGLLTPNLPLTNISTAYFQQHKDGATNFFPMCPVTQSAGFYYMFDKEDLLRDMVQKKPILGKVDPTVVSSHTGNYMCEAEQIILGYDQINHADILRSKAPGAINIRQSKSKIIAEQMYIHQNKLFAQKFFNEQAWGNVKHGGKDFTAFDDTASDPIEFFSDLIRDMKRATGRKPNKLGMGQRVYDKLRQNEALKERVIYGGSTPNPAQVNENVLAQLLDVEKIVVFDAIWNSAELGADGKMEFICDENSMLLCYATDTPAVDVATAGYTFSWDMGLGSALPIMEWDGEKMTFSQYIGGMMSMDMRKVCDDLGVFIKNAVTPE